MPVPTLEELAPDGHDLASDPYPVYAALRAEGPVHRVHVPGSGDSWLVVAHDVARAALTDPRLCNDIRHSASWESDGGHAVGRNMLQTDPPRHTRLRRLVATRFTAGSVAALRPRIEAVALELLDALPERGTADLVARYALPLPVTVICDLLGVPTADRAEFHAWSHELVVPTSPETATIAAGSLTEYLAGLTAPGRERPEGLIDDLVANPEITPEELLGMAFLILVAGHETTVDLISGTVHALLAHPDQLALLSAEPDLTDIAVEESLRFNSPVHSTAFRFATEPLDLGGTSIEAGDSVLVSLAAASRDPLRFPEPDRFDLRRPARGHLGFGHGLHHCLGAPLARAETSVALSLLLRHRPALAFATDPDSLTWRSSTLLRGLTRLPLRFG
ncbi:cytochrome P450 [Streptomyces griseorubiginosus]|uniref:cytochrome P450 family protein n=1 Tax=Streptomyces griseorubiginosus TaxID=67304 RepID=UPI002E80D538|nr:cytochrome P450 [Streptomyces griseorubiginosus]WUB48803.1 cytochrome P450 [Streptomyces griseorubiginosus]WUB57330.1 cytochrome P450 [Streptomyces griseorubiginosus]